MNTLSNEKMVVVVENFNFYDFKSQYYLNNLHKRQP